LALQAKGTVMALSTKSMRIAALIAVLVGIGGTAALLYGIPASSVQFDGEPPAILDRLELTEDPPVAPDPGFFGKDGEKVSLTQFRGRIVVLNLWATWCTPCVAELPALARLQAALGEKFAVVAVDLENLDAATVTEFLERHNAGSLGVYIDRERNMMRAYTAFALPLTAIIDPEGREIARSLGPQEWDHPDAVAYLRSLAEAKS
jgi:thiol-disulfide isomerase/thioredoxin